MAHTVTVDTNGTVATVCLNRPEVRNAFNAAMIEELTLVCRQLSMRDDIRVVVLRGNGRSFSAGADAAWMRASLEYSREENVADAGAMSDMFHAIDTIPQAVVGGVHGAALGGGMGLMAVCDVVVAEEGTVFGFTEAKLGIIPSVISRFVAPKIGPSWMRALYLSAERFDVETAQRIGLVHWVAPIGELDIMIKAKVTELLSSGPRAVREAKRLVADLAVTEESGIRDLTAARIADLRASPEGQEGLQAFLEKQQPSWRLE